MLSELQERRIAELRVVFSAKAESRLWRALGRVWPWLLWGSWTTTRLPLQASVVVWYPPVAQDPRAHHNRATVDHELHHARQLRPWWGPWVMAVLLVVGRWWMERRPYARAVRRGVVSPAAAADVLWREYFWPWPRSWMERWFEEQLDTEQRVRQPEDPFEDPLF